MDEFCGEEVISRVYVQTDEYGRITGCNGGYGDPAGKLADLPGWRYIDEGTGDRYQLCQTHYFMDGTENPDGTHRYIYDPSRSPAYREAAPEELEQERAEIEAAGVPPEPSAESSIQQALTDLELERIEQGQAITDLELSDIENGQKVTDLEIKVLELTENVQQYQSAL